MGLGLFVFHLFLPGTLMAGSSEIRPLPRSRYSPQSRAERLIAAGRRGSRGPASPFFLYFALSLPGATLRWRHRGTLWIPEAALAAFIWKGVCAAAVLRAGDFELNNLGRSWATWAPSGGGSAARCPRCRT